MGAPWRKPHKINEKSGILIEIHANPGASKTGIRGLHCDRLKLAVAARPVEGAANEAICRFLSDFLSVPLTRIHLIRGEQSRQKTVFIETETPDRMIALLNAIRP